MRTFGDINIDAQIDRNDLVNECEVQPLRYGFWSTQLADAKTTLERAKANLDAKIAERSLFYRRNPPGDIKPTEAVYDALLATDREVQEARDVYISAQEAVNTLYSAVAVMDQCKTSVDNLVKLQGMKFYGEKGSSYDDSITRMKGGN